MNNTCPTCGALYNVATKDIGRKIKCKKCSAALMVTDAGLVVDAGSASAPAVPAARPQPAPAPAAADFDVDDDREPVVKKKKGKYDRPPGAGFDILPLIPVAVFAFGVFLVIVFSSFPVIGEAGSDRARAYVQLLEIERDTEIEKLKPKKKQTEWTPEDRTKLMEDTEKVQEKYRQKIDDANMAARKTSVSNRRDKWLESYGLMFGFIILAFGCIAFLRMENPLVLKIVAAVILCFMMMILFLAFGGGCGGKSSSPIPIGKGGID